ncbi:putative Holliday junction resolvase [Phorcysia thermohydrogeniphila]|uniref:Putative pre-16S rRNA nuclease n=2 Tax=Phorcysia thermohydrogeniphila TaxID=936138 RepID=A0A4R1GB33_9BACT|nr:putative Holliday junction resolvase [Phorcysia thermohydrogeniphila]
MALDVGFKRIGVALSDPLRLTAYPYKIIHRKSNRETFEELLRIIDEKDVDTILVGVPLSLEGRDTKIGEKIKKFATKFQQFLKESGRQVSFVFVDESYSTLEATNLCRELGKKREEVDDIAAAIFLRDWLAFKGSP